MSRSRKQNIDRKTNKPDLRSTESTRPDPKFDRSLQTRRDNDVVKTPQRTVYDIDYAIKWFIDNEIQPQVKANGELINVPVIFANGEKWDSVRRLGYLRDEKGMLQAPLIMLKRNSLQERDQLKKLDINRPANGNHLIYKQKYNKRNRYSDSIFPIPINKPIDSSELYIINVPEYVDIEYDMLIWTDFTTQMNDMIEQFMPYGTFAWGNESNKYRTFIRNISFETVNVIGEDRLVRATLPLTVNGTLMASQEYRETTVQKRFSIKKLEWAQVIDIETDIFSTTIVPQELIDAKQRIISGNSVIVSGGGGGGGTTIDINTLNYLTQLTEFPGSIVDEETITIDKTAAINPSSNSTATVNEFDIFINGQYIDKAGYTWTPSDTGIQTIKFNTVILGYSIETTDTIIVKGRWSTN
tara:strand:+ start:1098 stop:2333 length:1236 start_codon:yes stop_codon:yes gene_type:complete